MCRAKTSEEALKAAGDLLSKGVAMATDAVKNVDTAQVRIAGHFVPIYCSVQEGGVILVVLDCTMGHADRSQMQCLREKLSALLWLFIAQLKAQAQQAAQMSAATVKSAIDAGLKSWAKYDKDGVSIYICVTLSPTLPGVVRSLLNIQCIACHPACALVADQHHAGLAVQGWLVGL